MVIDENRLPLKFFHFVRERIRCALGTDRMLNARLVYVRQGRCHASLIVPFDSRRCFFHQCLQKMGRCLSKTGRRHRAVRENERQS